MARGKKSAPRRSRPLMKRKRRNMRKRNNVSEYASLSVTRTLLGFTSNTMYVNPVINLASFTRAAAVGENYQRYRIKGVTLRIKPNMDAITSVAAGVPQKAYVYFMIDKTGSIPDNVTLEGLKQMGARPFALDEKAFKFTWAPAVHSYVKEVAGLTSPFSQYKISPWLTTSDNPNAPGAWTANTTEHYGYKLFIEQVGAVTTFNVDLEVQFEFIKPLLPALSATAATIGQYAEIDASPDGIVGGPDGITQHLPLGL